MPNILSTIVPDPDNEIYRDIVSYLASKIEMTATDYYTFHHKGATTIEITTDGYLTRFCINIESAYFGTAPSTSVYCEVDLLVDGSIDELCVGLFNALKKVSHFFNVKWLK